MSATNIVILLLTVIALANIITVMVVGFAAVELGRRDD